MAVVITSWKEKKRRVCLAIKAISDRYGDDDIEWLRQYCTDIIMDNKDSLDALLKYFESYVKEMPIRPGKVLHGNGLESR